MNHFYNHHKIIATVGPATRSQQMLIKLYEQGVHVIRLNFSHANYEEKEMVINLIHKLNSQWLTRLSILMDTKWPEIRTWEKKQQSHYQAGQLVKLTINDKACHEDDIYCGYPHLLEDIKLWDIIKIDSGLCDVEVISIESDHCMVRLLQDATIWSYRHINLPGKKLKLASLSHQDQQDLIRSIQHDIHIVAMSFVRSAQDIKDLRQFRLQHNWWSVCIFAKIENMEGLENLEEIIQVSDGIMVARWDLWIEADIAMIPLYQQEIINKCQYYGKAIIVATQMIESMMSHPFPTRAEIQDIAHAVQLSVDAVMLSGETAVGRYPIQAVQYMAHTVSTVQSYQINHRKVIHPAVSDWWRDDRWIIYKHFIQSAIYLVDQIDAQAILIFTKSWTGAKIASAYRPRVPVLACTWDSIVVEQLKIYYALYPVLLTKKLKDKDINHKMIADLLQQYHIQANHNPIVLISDMDTMYNHHPSIQIISAWS